MKECADGSFRHIDDSVYGPGSGMVIRYPVALAALEKAGSGRKVLLSAAGAPYTQKTAHRFTGLDHLILLCGHYEGFDARIEAEVDEEISIGDYILTGGELAAMVLTDCVARFIPGVLGSSESPEEESFSDGLLEYPQYTRPRELNHMTVPDVLLSGDHAKIRRWRRRESLAITARRRPDLLSAVDLGPEDLKLLDEIRKEVEIPCSSES